MKVLIIDSIVNDSADYEFITENAMHNTLRSLWDWAGKSSVSISFTKEYEKEGYGLRLLVWAEFENKEDYALFKLAFTGKPFNKLDINSDLEGRFVCG